MASGNFLLTNSGSTSEYITLNCNWGSVINGISENSSTVTASITAALSLMASQSISGSFTGQITVNGNSQSTGALSFSLLPGEQTVLFTRSYIVPHNYDGSKSTTITASVSGSTISGSGADTVVLDNIPRYASVSQTLQEKTETSITINWVSNVSVDKVWYSIDMGHTWAETGQTGEFMSGAYEITSLALNTSYGVKTRVKNKDSQLTSESATLTVTTYGYPYCLVTPNFTIGNILDLTFYNPLSRTITVNLIGDDGSQISNNSISGTEISGFNTTEIINKLYASIPDSQSGTYSVKVTYGTNINTVTGGEYRVNPNECLPGISSVSYSDSNPTTIAITNNNQQIIQNQSTVLFNASGISANKSATIESCNLSVNSVSYPMTVSGNTATASNITVDSANNLEAEVIATDSRGLQISKYVNLDMLNWRIPAAIIDVSRENNISSNTNITVNAIYSSLNNKNTITIQCRYKKAAESSYSNYQTLQDNVTETLTLDNNYIWDIQVLLTDKLGSTTYNLQVLTGNPIVFFDSTLCSTGFNCFPKEQNSVEINGINIKREAMTYNLSANVTTLTTNNYTKITLDSAKSTNTNVFSASSGGIKIGKFVNRILINSQVVLTAGNASGQRHVVIIKNSYSLSNVLAYASANFSSNDTKTLTISQQLIDVSENDIIYLYYYTGTATDAIIGDSYGGRTFLTIEKLD